MDTPIYLDYAASTPLSRYVAKAMADFLQSPAQTGNPSSTTHAFGWDAQEIVTEARENVASLIGCRANEVIFTSGATEANNIALQGFCTPFLERGDPIHIITSRVEHKAVLSTCEQLEKQGVEVTYLTPDSNGLITVEQVKAAHTSNTRLVSLMLVNNELGNINDISAIGAWTKERSIVFHVDASQGIGKISLHWEDDTIDLLSLSGHKIYGPKGIGALVARRTQQRSLNPILFGGDQERKLRPGTLATHQILGLGEACRLLSQTQQSHSDHVAMLSKSFLETLDSFNVEFTYNSTTTESHYPGIINLHFAGIDSDLLLMSLPELAFSIGSACNSAQQVTSHVLEAIHPERSRHSANIRISFGLMLSQQEVVNAASRLAEKVMELRHLDE